ncbi:hypothetical protein HIM_12685 [Hirsutella minnesotensis 3608]|uniref:BZIP domain-containing protein n=1 Tax=Hirsutella minnesotensis 3608 TaxID=1043627 RepID=A0A0F7ZET0_9HYPO|nr:hypothetical protein HIM_12685 [Hirsutella minnesotensis 3608]
MPCHSRSNSLNPDAEDTATPISLPAKPSSSYKSGRSPGSAANTQWKRTRKCQGGSEDSSKEAANDSRVLRAQEKNRIAADKCRSKKRRAVAQLKSKYETLEAKHRQLLESVSDLVSETHTLKNMLMQHGNCNCALIQKYLGDTASRWVVKKTDACSTIEV